MKTIPYIVLMASLPLLCFSCTKNNTEAETVPGPVLVSTDPADGAKDLTGTSITLAFTFDQNVFCPSSEQSRITVADAVLDGVNAVGKQVCISLSGLERGKSYTAVLPAGTVSGFKNNPADAISLSWTMKEPDKHYTLAPTQSLHDPEATDEAARLYSYLLGIYGSKTLSGAMGGTAWTTKFPDYINDFSGEYPAIVGFDYLFMDWPPKAWSDCPDYGDISVVRGAWESGNLIQIGWHWCVPKFAGATPSDYSYNTKAFTVTDALTPGTWQHDTLDSQIAKLAGYLSLIQDAGIPVLFRPLHEAAGDYTWGAWFWWGYDGAAKCIELWKYLHDKLTHTYGLHNLIWVWTVQTSDKGALATVDKLEQWYPGDDYVDIVGADLYEAAGTSQADRFQRVLDSVKGTKMVALSECGSLLSPDKYMAEGAPWLYFMGWEDSIPLSSSTNGWNTEDSWTQVLENTYIINRDEVPGI